MRPYRGLGFAADATSIAGFRDWAAPVIQGFETWGGRIREQQRPGPRVTPEEAGAGVSQRQRAGMASEAAKQDTAFGTIRQVAGQHVEMRPVIRVDAKGNPVTVNVQMAAPVDVRAVKAALAPEVRLKEPRTALAGGKDGLDFYRRLTADAPAHLKDGGFLAVEVGIHQAAPVAALAVPAFSHTEILKDYAGIERVVIAWK